MRNEKPPMWAALRRLWMRRLGTTRAFVQTALRAVTSSWIP